MSNTKKRDIVEGAVYAAIIVELVDAAKMVMLMCMDPEVMPKQKARLKENHQILMANFTK